VTSVLANIQKPVYREGFISAVDGVELFYREWSPVNTEITSVVLFIHGIGLNSDSHPYGEKILMPGLLDKGTAFYSIDLRGHGHSGGGIDNIQQYALIRDITSHIKHIKEDHKNAAIILYGHNFGGILALYYASRSLENVRCVIISEYSKLIKENVKRIRRPNSFVAISDMVIQKFYHRSRRFEFLTPQEYERLCSQYKIPLDSDILNSLESSAFGEKCVTYGKEFFSACGVGHEQQIFDNISIPVLMIFSRNDPFFDIKGAYDIIREIKSLDKELRLVDTGGHYNIIETSRDIVSKWISSRITN